jgi:hypothetical protein
MNSFRATIGKTRVNKKKIKAAKIIVVKKATK